MTYYIGIDPGITGAMAVINGQGKAELVIDLPIMAKGKGKGSVKTQINARALYDILLPWSAMDDIACIVEQTNAMPKQGVASMFSMGHTLGVIQAVVLCIGFGTAMVPPATWKKYYKLTKDKEQARALAIQKFPNIDLSLKKHHNRAEALLIAYWGYTQRGNL